MLASRWHRCIGLRAAYHGGIGVRSSSYRATSTATAAPVIISHRPGGGVEAVGGDVLDPPRARVPGTARRRDQRRLENRLSSSSSSSSPPASSSSSSFARSEYVHPLSQIVLERLQSSHADWVSRVGLDTGLRLNGDGTFVLRFPPPGGGVATDAAAVAAEDVVGSVFGDPASGGDDAGGSIWTMYEPDEKKHYLCVTRGGLVGRYMLQDNKKPAWHTDKRSTPERVQDAVDEMIAKFDEEV